MRSTALKWTVNQDSDGKTGRADAGPRLPKAKQERVIALCEGMVDLAAAMFNVSSKELRLANRCSPGVARVRQIAMYVAHVVLEISMREVGEGFGRDRTTVLHACHQIEDLRDDEEFDAIVATFERVAKVAFGQPETQARI